MSFKRLDPEDFLVSAESIVGPAWSNNSASLTDFEKSNSQQASPSGDYYMNVYAINPNSSPNADIQFAIAYGDIKGSGSQLYSDGVPGLSPSRTVYGQFVNLLLGEDENASFNFGGSATNENFYAIVINRARYKQAIMPGVLQIRGLAPGGDYITDNSLITPVVDYTPAGRKFILGSGSYGNGVEDGADGVYGYLYPDVGIIILNPDALNITTNRQSDTDNNNPENVRAALTLFSLQSQETVTSDFIFCRARNAEFNYSINPSFSISSSAGTVLFNDFVQNPSTYISSVGMYNDNNELLAVAKLSKPLKKDFTKEALIRVKLDF
jgi:hypothetical protein